MEWNFLIEAYLNVPQYTVTKHFQTGVSNDGMHFCSTYINVNYACVVDTQVAVVILAVGVVIK